MVEIAGISAPVVVVDSGVRDASPVYTLNPQADPAIVAAIDAAQAAGDTLGGVIETIVTGCPIGLGSHTQWDRKLDARLAAAVMSIQAIKGVEIGLGFEAARRPGSKVMDPYRYEPDHPHEDRQFGFRRPTNNAGGIEGGTSNGEPIIIRAAKKPISTLAARGPSVNMATKVPPPPRTSGRTSRGARSQRDRRERRRLRDRRNDRRKVRRHQPGRDPGRDGCHARAEPRAPQPLGRQGLRLAKHHGGTPHPASSYSPVQSLIEPAGHLIYPVRSCAVKRHKIRFFGEDGDTREARMFPLTRPLRQGLATAALFAFTIVPTAFVGLYAWRVNRPGHIRDVEIELGRQLGLQVTLEAVRYPRPGEIVYQGIVLRQEEPRGKGLIEIARAGLVRLVRTSAS